MKIRYDASDIKEAIITLLAESWPRQDGCAREWQGICEQIKSHQVLAGRLCSRACLTLDRDLLELLEDLETLLSVARHRHAGCSAGPGARAA